LAGGEEEAHELQLSTEAAHVVSGLLQEATVFHLVPSGTSRWSTLALADSLACHRAGGAAARGAGVDSSLVISGAAEMTCLRNSRTARLDLAALHARIYWSSARLHAWHGLVAHTMEE
jgi:hypothetical protein